MRTELYANSGFYSSAFFKMHVHTDESLLDISKVSLETEATYAHEYIHFLQDISCVYGLMNISAIVDYLKLVNNKPLEDKKSEIIVPFIPEHSPDNNVQANWLLKSIYLGDKKGVNDIKRINKICKCLSPIFSNSGTKNAEKIIIEYVDSFGNSQQYSFGAVCVTESMAYSIEKVLYPDVLPVPNKFPYSSVNEVCDFILPGFSDDPLNIIALCDACLMLFQPGKFLYDSLLEMARIQFVPKKPEEIYDFVYANVKFNFRGHSTFDQLLISFGAEAICQIGGYFTTPIFKENKHWINYIITSAIDLRLHYPYFILNFTKGGQIKNNSIFWALINKIGAPIVVNDKEELSITKLNTTNYDIVPEYLWVIYQIYKMCSYDKKFGGLNNGTLKCEMIEFCQKSAKDQGLQDWTDYDRCRNAPWERANDPDTNFCTFGRMWKTWGLKDIKPVNESLEME